jgi:hypothetical protein
MAVGNTVGFVYVQVFADTVNFGKQIDKDLKKNEDKWVRWSQRIRNRLRQAGTGGWFDTLTNGLSGMIGLAEGVGRSFTKIIGGIGEGFFRAGAFLQKFSDKFDGLFKMASGPLSKMGGLIGEVGIGLASLAKDPRVAAAALVVAIGALNAVLAMAVSLVSALAAGVVALGSALYYTVAAAGILVPIVGAITVGFAGAAIGAIDATQAVGKLWKVMNETDPKKKAAALKEYNRELARLGPNAAAAVQALAPLIKEFTGLKKLAGEALFKGMADALGKAAPLIAAMKDGLVLVAGAVGNVVDKFLMLGQNEAFLRDFNKMWASSAEIIEWLGAAVVNLFAGFTSFFAAIAPLSEKFAQSLAKVSETFASWAASPEGQAAITEFFTTAYDMASAVWAIVKELGLALHDLFTADATQAAAEGFLGFILEKIQQFRQFIAEAAADGRLQAWFDQAKQVGLALWDVLKAIGGFLKGLNTPENTAWLVALLKGIAAIVTMIGIAMGVASFFFNAFFGWVRNAITLVSGLVGWIKKAADAIGRLRLPSWLPGDWGQNTRSTSRTLTTTQLAPLGAPVGGSMVTNYWNITTPSADSRVVASQVLNRSMAMAG